MALLEYQKYYANLLIIQYHGKPKAVATINCLSEMSYSDDIIKQISDAFSINNAFGFMLDIIGKYSGVKRSGRTLEGFATLTDEEFRILISLANQVNKLDASFYSIKRIIRNNFGNSMRVYDHRDMRMSYMISASISSQVLAQMFISQGLLPSPMGVGIGSIIYANNIDIFFGFSTYLRQNFKNTTWRTYDNPNIEGKWLTYNDGLNSLSNSESFLLTENSDFLVQEDDGKLVR